MIDPDVELFARIAEAGSLAEAARQLGMSAPMVSRRLARLEERLGVTLATRTTRKLTLTPLGDRFRQDVAGLLEQWHQAEQRIMRSARVASGPLRISAPTSFGRMYVAPAVKPFIDDFPDVHVTLDLSDSFVDLVEGRFDLAIRIADGIPTGAQSEQLAGSARILCAAPSYLADHGVPRMIADIANHRILAAEGQLPWKLVWRGKPLSLPGRSQVTTNSSEVVRELALTGMGIALRSLWDVHADLAMGRLIRILPEVEGSLDVGIFAVRPLKHRISAASEAFVEYLKHRLQPTAPWDMPSDVISA